MVELFEGVEAEFPLGLSRSVTFGAVLHEDWGDVGGELDGGFAGEGERGKGKEEDGDEGTHSGVCTEGRGGCGDDGICDLRLPICDWGEVGLFEVGGVCLS